MRFRWRGRAGPPLVAFCSDAAAPRPKRGEDSNDHREYLTDIVVELVAIYRGIAGHLARRGAEQLTVECQALRLRFSRGRPKGGRLP